MRTSSGRRSRLLLLAPIFGAILALGIVVWALIVDRERYDLRWKLRPGEILRYRTVQQMGSAEQESCHVSVSSYRVGSVFPDGAAQITMIQEQATIRKGGPQGPVMWDSASGAPPPEDLSIVMAWAMNGIPLLMKVDQRGGILSIEGLDRIKSRIRDTLGGDMFGGLTDLPLSMSGGAFIGPLLPGSPIATSGRWTQESITGTDTWGSSVRQETFVFKSVRQDVAVISLLKSKELKRTPGDVEKALKIDGRSPDSNAGSGAEMVAEFSIAGGVLLLERDRSWSQGTLTNGKVFRFEGRSETTLIERRAR